MVISFAHLSPLLSILFGILILVFPRLLNYLVAVYLILAGLLGIGLIGRPLRARAEFNHVVPASAPAECRPAAETAASLTPTNVVYGKGEVRRSLGASLRQARRAGPVVAGNASLPLANSSLDRPNGDQGLDVAGGRAGYQGTASSR
jgi:hypothetical protein